MKIIIEQGIAFDLRDLEEDVFRDWVRTTKMFEHDFRILHRVLGRDIIVLAQTIILYEHHCCEYIDFLENYLASASEYRFKKFEYAAEESQVVLRVK